MMSLMMPELSSNKTFDDILLREDLQKYAEKRGDRFQLWHACGKAPNDKKWKYGEGKLDEELM